MTAGIVGVVWLGGGHVLSGALTVGAFVAYLDLYGRLVGRGFRIPQLVNSVQSGAAAFARLEPLLAAPASVDGEPHLASFRPGHLVGLDTPAQARVHPVTGPAHVALRGATFSYPGASEPAIEGLTLGISPGDLVAVTGPIGSGKSALARCLAGVYPVDAGEILIDGSPLSEIVAGRTGYAPQHGDLFSGSVRENVFLSSGPSLDSEMLLDSLRLADLDEDIAAMPRGADTPIGEQGIRISGGQRQRLGLARAAAAAAPSRPGLLVLDDPFSAVDVDTESRIIANLRQTFGPTAPPERRATVILFSQRLAAFPQADLVVVLDGGRIRELGTHQDLLGSQGLYARIYRAQQRMETRATAAGSTE
jgi:ABC-type bacteriocin/lantibiotic exporter with double-glycine peptidase domain